MDPYDRMILAGPPDPPTADAMVEYTVWVDREWCSLADLTKQIGGEAHFSSGRRDDWIEVSGSTSVPDVESAEAAEEIVRNLLTALQNVVDIDTLVTTTQDPFEPDEPDWDAIEKDRRIEESRT